MPLIILIIIVLVLCAFIVPGFTGAPWVPSRNRDLEAFFAAVHLGPGKRFCDLGCGDGKTLALAARTGATVNDIERNPFLWALAAWRLRRVPGAKVYWGDLWAHDVSNVDVVMVFLIPRFMERLGAKLQRELPAGAYAISYIFRLPGRTPVKRSNKVWLYRF